jgi:hypothetical protein
MRHVARTLALGVALLLSSGYTRAQSDGGEWQLTFSPINKALDNNDNFSRDGRFLVYDTRETVGPGIDNSLSIMKVSITTGLENYVYAPYPAIYGTVSGASAPGVAAVSFSPVSDQTIFIHGPLVSEVAARGYYGKTNRRGGVATADGSGDIGFLDCRDVLNPVTTPGALRGGTHRHEFTADGSRIGFTYDDYLLTSYGRTIGFMMPAAKSPCGGATHNVALLVKVVPKASAVAGDIVQASDDSWVGAAGLMRGFIGVTMQKDGTTINSLYVVDIPATVDITTADSGTATKYPTPPQGVTIRRLTNTSASGIVRGSLDGTRIAYYATATDGTKQVFIINSQGSDQSADASMQPIQVTSIAGGVSGGVHWHPSGNSIAVMADNGVMAVCVKSGALFGKTTWLTSHGTGVLAPDALIWSRDGSRLAFTRRIPYYNASGNIVKNANGVDFNQIFVTNFFDNNGDGIADALQ